MRSFISIALGKAIILFGQVFKLGSGSTWPGYIALLIDPSLVNKIIDRSKTKIVVIAGTNGKTTTGKLISEILKANKKRVLHNAAGANLENGLASALVKGATLSSFARPGLAKLNDDYLIFESDEYALPKIIEQTSPDYIICLNLFRDQLDRYGEIDSIAKRWRSSFEKLSTKTTLILNADDPQVSYLSKNIKAKVLYFGLEKENDNTKTKHGADSIYCPNCSIKLKFSTVFFSHLGIWECPNCHLQRPKPDLSTLKSYPLPGTYNKYNSLAAVLIGKNEGVSTKDIEDALKSFTPAFGRQEQITYKGRIVQIFLSKNPTSFNESLQTIKELGGKNLLILLNDRIPDGLDVSWIWDINLEEVLPEFESIVVSGDRAYDMGLRIKYATSSEFKISNLKFKIEPDLKKSLDYALANLNSDQVLYVLPNYSAMLDIRKILIGRKIL